MSSEEPEEQPVEKVKVKSDKVTFKKLDDKKQFHRSDEKY